MALLVVFASWSWTMYYYKVVEGVAPVVDVLYVVAVEVILVSLVYSNVKLKLFRESNSSKSPYFNQISQQKAIKTTTKNACEQDNRLDWNLPYALKVRLKPNLREKLTSFSIRYARVETKLKETCFR